MIIDKRNPGQGDRDSQMAAIEAAAFNVKRRRMGDNGDDPQ